jgi:hypothetical protein
MGTWSLSGNSLGTPPTGVLGTTDNNPLVIETGGKPCVWVNPSGNIGVGLSSPTAPLHLALGKGLRIEGGTNATDATDYFSFGGNGSFGIDAPGVSNGRFAVLNSGNVGVGTPSPATRLHVNGDLTVSSATGLQTNVLVGGGSSGFSRISSIEVPAVPVGTIGIAEYTNGSQLSFSTFPVVTLLRVAGAPAPAPVEAMRIDQSGRVGIGTAAPVATLDIGGGTFHLSEPANPTAITTPVQGAYIAWNALTGGTGETDFINNQGGGTGGFAFMNTPSSGSPRTTLLVISGSGNLQIPGDILLTGADCAEHFDTSSPEPPEPGTVLVIDQDGALTESRDAYDKKVAGIVSGAGDYRHGIVLDQRPDSEGRVPVALVGKVYCKVDADYSSIEVGDLLTTSGTPGHAMKVLDAAKAFGSVIGKALRPLAGGKGLIPVLIALQ